MANETNDPSDNGLNSTPDSSGGLPLRPRRTIRDAIQTYEKSEENRVRNPQVPEVNDNSNSAPVDDNSDVNYKYWDNLAQQGESKQHHLDREYYEATPFFSGISDADEIMKDPTDFTDVTAVRNRNSALKWGSVVAGTIVIALGAYFGVSALTDTNGDSDSISAEEERPSSNPAATDPEAPNRPLLDIYPEAPEVSSGISTAIATGSTITTSENSALTINGITLVAAENECSVNAPTDFCLAAVSSEDVQTVHTYYLKDAANSRMFENPTNFTPVEVPGASAAAALDIALAGGKMTPIVVVVLPNSSGFMMALPDATSVDEAVAFAGTLNVK